MIINGILISQIKDNVVYRIHNIIDDKNYIGSTTQFNIRMRQHMNGKLKWQQEFREHPEHFELELLERNVPEKELEERELFYINKYDSVNKGYNRNKNVSRVKFVDKESLSAIHQQSEETIKSIKNKVHEYYDNPDIKKQHGEKTSQAMKKLQITWINNGHERKRPPLTEVEKWLAKGYVLGKGSF